MFKHLRRAAVLIPFFSIGAAPMMAQTFTNPVADEFVYGSSAVINPKVTANYSRTGISAGFGTTDLYLSAWSSNDPSGRGEFIYTFTAPSVPTAIAAQGSFIYGGVADIEVGIVQDGGGGHWVVVTYYDYLGMHSPTGSPGHILDMYKMTGSVSSPLALAVKNQLSYSPNYGRIRMDSHKDYAVAIAWDYHGVGIQTTVCDMGNWSGVTTLNGTAGEEGPDVAFSHTNNLLNVRFVYQNPAAGTITESMLDWPLLLSIPFGSTATIPPAVEDITGAPFPISNLVLDCPDHYDVENWAYTYTDGDRVFVRHLDYHSWGVPVTTIVNDGSLGNAPLTTKYTAHTPTLHYGDGAIGGSAGQISVGWYCTYTFSGFGPSHYIGIEMKESGTSILNAPDYMRLPNSYVPFSFSNSGIAYSKISDAPGSLAPDYMYATYFTETSPGSGNYDLHHAFHKWNNPIFRGGTPTPKHEVDCKSPSKQEQVAILKTNSAPNPFQNRFTNNIALKETANVMLTLVDVTGQVVAQKSATLNKGNHTIEMSGLDKLPAGNYILSTSVNGKISGTQVMVKQQ